MKKQQNFGPAGEKNYTLLFVGDAFPGTAPSNAWWMVIAQLRMVQALGARSRLFRVPGFNDHPEGKAVENVRAFSAHAVLPGRPWRGFSREQYMQIGIELIVEQAAHAVYVKGVDFNAVAHTVSPHAVAFDVFHLDKNAIRIESPGNLCRSCPGTGNLPLPFHRRYFPGAGLQP